MLDQQSGPGVVVTLKDHDGAPGEKTGFGLERDQVIRIEIRCDVWRDGESCHSHADKPELTPKVWMSSHTTEEKMTQEGVKAATAKAEELGWRFTELGWICPVCQTRGEAIEPRQNSGRASETD